MSYFRDNIILGTYTSKVRRTGYTLQSCKDCKPNILAGESISLMDFNGPDYANRIASIFRSEWNIQLVIKPMYKLEPANNRVMHYDEWGEPSWLEILPQTRVVYGYSLRMFDIDNDWHPNESF